MAKFNVVKVVGVVGAVLSVVGSLASNWTSDKKMDETITKKVEEALKNK